jgi:hypothetical protein
MASLPPATVPVLDGAGALTLPWRRALQTVGDTAASSVTPAELQTVAAEAGAASAAASTAQATASAALSVAESATSGDGPLAYLSVAMLDQTSAAPAAPSIISTNVAASFTTSSAYNCYFLDTSGGAYTVTMNASPGLNEVAEVWDSTGHAGTNPVSFNGNGKTIAGSATLTSFVAINFGHARLIYNGTQWLMS